jgi:hypothetical protein
VVLPEKNVRLLRLPLGDRDRANYEHIVAELRSLVR